MKLYASSPGRATAQLTGDVLLVVWVYVMVRLGQLVHSATMQLAEPGRRIEGAGRDLGKGLAGAADRLSGLPVVGDDVRQPLDDASRATGAIVRAGQEQQTAVAHLAMLLGVLIAIIPILLAVLGWVPFRVRFVRRASAAQRFIDAAPDLDLFALRAMANQPMQVLARISDDPAGAWRRGDAAVIRSLATVELRRVGLRPPAVPSGID